jgi:FeS assembly SUF system regulator
MLKISKLADYGTVVMAYLAHQNDFIQNANEIAVKTGVALPTVSKILKILARYRLLVSHRGTKGGYSLAYPPEQISVLQIIHAMDGGIALTKCSQGTGLCRVEHHCVIQHNWQLISNAIHVALDTVSLADIIRPMSNAPTVNFKLGKEIPQVKRSGTHKIEIRVEKS